MSEGSQLNTSINKIFKEFKRFRRGTLSVPDDEELTYLEKVVLGSGAEAFEESNAKEDSYGELSPKKRRVVEPKKPAWVDEDDNVDFSEVVKKQGRKCTPGVSDSKKYQVVMEEKYQEVMSIPKWSHESLSKKTPVDDLLNKCGNFIKKPKFLKEDVIEFKKLQNLNFETHSEGPCINVIKFHPKATVAMVAGASGIVSIFQVDGKQNPKLQSLQFQRYPIHCGSFLRNGEEFLIGSQFYKYFYSHNLMTGHSIKVDFSKVTDITKTKKFCVSPKDDIIAVCGNTGKIYLFVGSSKEYIDCLQMNGNVTAIDFNQNGTLLYSHGEDGEVYIWDMKSRRCIQKFIDEGCLKGTSIAISQNNQFIACGSCSGIVNIYSSENVNSGKISLPTKSINNLVTPITSVKFNSSSEILALASGFKDNAVKLVHCPSMTVYSNFPPFSGNIKKPLCIDFSPNSGFFAVGNNKGSAYLFRFNYFGSY